MSKLFDKQVNAQKESLKNTSRVHANSRKLTKVCDENERNNKQEKQRMRKNVIDGRSFIVRL